MVECDAHNSLNRIAIRFWLNCVMFFNNKLYIVKILTDCFMQYRHVTCCCCCCCGWLVKIVKPRYDYIAFAQLIQLVIGKMVTISKLSFTLSVFVCDRPISNTYKHKDQRLTALLRSIQLSDEIVFDFGQVYFELMAQKRKYTRKMITSSLS